MKRAGAVRDPGSFESDSTIEALRERAISVLELATRAIP
jgi:hypothetical protein